MKKLMLASALGALIVSGPALSADLPYKAPPPAPVPYFSWTGCYIGGHAGAAWGERKFDNSILFNNGPTTALRSDHLEVDYSGYLGGGQVGCQWQITSVVLGVEGDGSGTNLSRDANDPFLLRNFSARIESLWDVTGRLGWAWDRFLIYVKGGAAWADISIHDPVFGENSVTRDGWVIGGGVEWAFYENWSAKLEYLHYDFNGRTFGITGLGGPAPLTPFTLTSNVQQTVDTFKVGINYRFFPWGAPAAPVVARY